MAFICISLTARDVEDFKVSLSHFLFNLLRLFYLVPCLFKNWVISFLDVQGFFFVFSRYKPSVGYIIGPDVSPFFRLPSAQVMVSFAVQKLCSFFTSHLLIIGLSACTLGVRSCSESTYFPSSELTSWVSWKYQQCGSCFLIQSASLYVSLKT